MTTPSRISNIAHYVDAKVGRDGRLLGVEVKAKAGRLRPEQAIFIERIRGAGGVAFVARDCRDVLRELSINLNL